MKYIIGRQDAKFGSVNKMGVLNKQGWAAYYLDNTVLIKKFAYEASALYPDFGCNNEVYINGAFLEVETLSPLLTLAPGETAEHTEYWSLHSAETMKTMSEASIDRHILPLV